MNNKYIGNRYVPKILGEWDNTKNTEYESLVIVTYGGNSFTSNTIVPKGIDITNTNYWTPTGNYNAQVELYRQDTITNATNISKCITDIANVKAFYVDYVSVKDYGAKGDGTTIDTLAFVNAIATGKNVFVPSGTYNIDSKLTLTHNSQSIFGNGFYNSIIKASSNFTDETLIEMRGENSPAYRSDQYLNEIGIDCNNKTNGVKAVFNASFKIEHCRIYNAIKGLFTQDALIFQINDCEISLCDTAIYFGGKTTLSPANIALFTNCKIYSNKVVITQNLEQDIGANIIFDTCEFEANGLSETRPCFKIKSYENFGNNSILSFKTCWFERNGNPNTFDVDLGENNDIIFDNCSLVTPASTIDRFLLGVGSGSIVMNNIDDTCTYKINNMTLQGNVRLIAYNYFYQIISVANKEHSVIYDSAGSRCVTDKKIYGAKLKLSAQGGTNYSELYNSLEEKIQYFDELSCIRNNIFLKLNYKGYIDEIIINTVNDIYNRIEIIYCQ
jgi:hypothetical protein